MKRRSIWMVAATLLSLLMVPFIMIQSAYAVSEAEDIATTIKLRNYDCGGRAVSDISETEDENGNRVIQATCPNGRRYQITVSSDGRMQIQPLN